jgi:hypothetical protein
MLKRLKKDLYACGEEGLPKVITLREQEYRLTRTFKHDFFAATGYYEPIADNRQNSADVPCPLVLKINRTQPFFGIPLAWLGRGLCSHEIRILEKLNTLDQVPKLAGRWGLNGFVYPYIEGRSLDEKPPIPDGFFEDLETLLNLIHQRHVCYIDLNKRGNILLGRDGRPYLIDFQISLAWKRHGQMCCLLQKEDHYHLLKHKRRLRPDLLSPQQRKDSYRKSIWIQIHRAATWPYRFLRRGMMRWLWKHGYLQEHTGSDLSPENDPQRFKRR